MIKTVGSICSGIEAASVAWKPMGVSFKWFSEIAPFPSVCRPVPAQKYTVPLCPLSGAFHDGLHSPPKAAGSVSASEYPADFHPLYIQC